MQTRDLEGSAIVFSRSHSFWERFFFFDEQITFLGVRHGLVCVPQTFDIGVEIGLGHPRLFECNTYTKAAENKIILDCTLKYT